MGTAPDNNNKILLQNGLLIDGTGTPGRKANVLMEQGRLRVMNPSLRLGFSIFFSKL